MIFQLNREECEMVQNEIINMFNELLDPYAIQQAVTNLALGGLNVWAVHRDKDKAVIGLFVTKDITDIFGDKQVLIYALKIFGETTKEVWHEEFNSFTKLQRQRGVRKIIAFTNNPKMYALAEMLDFTFKNYCEKKI